MDDNAIPPFTPPPPLHNLPARYPMTMDAYETYIKRRKESGTELITWYKYVDTPPLVLHSSWMDGFENYGNPLEPRLNVTPEGEQGWGVQILDPVAPDTFLGFVLGEVICWERKKLRKDGTHTFDLFYPLPCGLTHRYYVDSGAYTSKLGFANHSCAPNAYWSVMVKKGQVVLTGWSRRALQGGTFLHFDYYTEKDPEDISVFGENGCMCGSSKCRFKPKVFFSHFASLTTTTYCLSSPEKRII